MSKITTARAIGTVVRNDSATIVYGTVRGRVVTNAPGRVLIAGNTEDQGGRQHVKAPAGARYFNYTAKAISAGKFGFTSNDYVNDRNTFIIRGTNRKIAQQSNTSLLMTPANRHRRSIAFNEHNNTRHTTIADGVTYNYATGQPTSEPVVTVDTFGNDVAAHPTKAVPGHLTFLISKNLPTSTNYSAKNG